MAVADDPSSRSRVMAASNPFDIPPVRATYLTPLITRYLHDPDAPIWRPAR